MPTYRAFISVGLAVLAAHGGVVEGADAGLGALTLGRHLDTRALSLQEHDTCESQSMCAHRGNTARATLQVARHGVLSV